jgi:hypothetical protein
MLGARNVFHSTRTQLAILVIALAGTACSTGPHLSNYDFRNKTLTVTTVAPARPEILGDNSRGGRAADGDLLALGSAIVMEVSARQAMPRLQKAASNVDVSGRVGDRVLDVAARHLRAVPLAIPGPADFEIEIRIDHYGITASSWDGSTNFLLDAQLFLRDGETGRRIWSSEVHATQPLRPLLANGDPTISEAVSAITLSNMSTEQLEMQFESLADFSADELLAELIDALDHARG